MARAIIFDSAGEKVRRDYCPNCFDQKKDCFAYRCGKCSALQKENPHCNFYKPVGVDFFLKQEEALGYRDDLLRKRKI